MVGGGWRRAHKPTLAVPVVANPEFEHEDAPSLSGWVTAPAQPDFAFGLGRAEPRIKVPEPDPSPLLGTDEHQASRKKKNKEEENKKPKRPTEAEQATGPNTRQRAARQPAKDVDTSAVNVNVNVKVIGHKRSLEPESGTENINYKQLTGPRKKKQKSGSPVKSTVGHLCGGQQPEEEEDSHVWAAPPEKPTVGHLRVGQQPKEEEDEEDSHLQPGSPTDSTVDRLHVEGGQPRKPEVVSNNSVERYKQRVIQQLQELGGTANATYLGTMEQLKQPPGQQFRLIETIENDRRFIVARMPKDCVMVILAR